MIWTSEPPKVAGWYWWRAANVRMKVVEIYSHTGRLHINGDALKLFAGEWSSTAIAPPQETGG